MKHLLKTLNRKIMDAREAQKSYAKKRWYGQAFKAEGVEQGLKIAADQVKQYINVEKAKKKNENTRTF